MADERTGYKHDSSDRKLDQSAQAATDETKASDARSASRASHDEGEIRKHDDTGKDRLFEGRQQHDEAEKNSEKTRLARDVERHDHEVGDGAAG